MRVFTTILEVSLDLRGMLGADLDITFVLEDEAGPAAIEEDKEGFDVLDELEIGFVSCLLVGPKNEDDFDEDFNDDSGNKTLGGGELGFWNLEERFVSDFLEEEKNMCLWKLLFNRGKPKEKDLQNLQQVSTLLFAIL